MMKTKPKGFLVSSSSIVFRLISLLGVLFWNCFNFSFIFLFYFQGPQGSVDKPFLWTEGRVNLKASLNKSAYTHSENVNVTIDVRNDSRKVVRKIRVSFNLLKRILKSFTREENHLSLPTFSFFFKSFHEINILYSSENELGFFLKSVILIHSVHAPIISLGNSGLLEFSRSSKFRERFDSS